MSVAEWVWLNWGSGRGRESVWSGVLAGGGHHSGAGKRGLARTLQHGDDNYGVCFLFRRQRATRTTFATRKQNAIQASISLSTQLIRATMTKRTPLRHDLDYHTTHWYLNRSEDRSTWFDPRARLSTVLARHVLRRVLSPSPQP